MSWYGVKLIVHVANDMNYFDNKIHEVVENVWGPFGGDVTKGFIVVLQIAVSIASILFTAEFLENEFCSDYQYCGKKHVYLIGALCMAHTIIFIENLACFAYVSLFSVVMILLSVGAILVTCIVRMATDDKIEISTNFTKYEWSGIPDYIGLSLYAMEGIGMIFPIRGAMKKPPNYLNVFTNSIKFIASVCLSIQCICY